MIKFPSKTYVVIGALTMFSGITMLVFFVSFLLSNIAGEEKVFNIEEPAFNSRYISEDESSDTLVTQPDEVYQENIVNEKQGILEVNESRKVVTFNEALSEAEIKDIENTYNVEILDEKVGGNIYVLNTTEESNLEALSSEYTTVVETDIPVKMSADTIDWGISRIGADKVWEVGNGVGIKIAIVDTGVQSNHPDLQANLLSGYDFVNGDEDANDDNGHGTHVAGIASATLNQSGTVGAGYGAKILPIKVLNNQGYGYLSDVAKGIYYAADNGARIINLSLGTSTDSLTLRNAVTYAANKGVLLVAAAGNDGGAPCSYPAAYSSVICVVATDNKNQLASFSNLGGELAAPGVSNYSTFLGSTYRYLSGTSMASPHVAGAAAVVMSACATCSTSEVRSLLRDTAVDLGEQGKDILFGYGLVDLVSAMNTFNPPAEEEQPIEEEPTPTVPSPEKTKNVNIPSKIVQKLVVEEPVLTRGNKYIPQVAEDITVLFGVTPYVEETTLQKITVSLDNTELFSTTKQEDTYLISKDLLNHSQHWLTISATFNDNSQSTEKIVIDMTYLKSLESSTTRGRSVLGISFSIFDLFKIF